jgi:hypothetical protein
MIPVAHASHWAISALYAAPVIVVLIAIVHNAFRDRADR